MTGPSQDNPAPAKQPIPQMAMRTRGVRVKVPRLPIPDAEQRRAARPLRRPDAAANKQTDARSAGLRWIWEPASSATGVSDSRFTVRRHVPLLFGDEGK